jgi:hypothetical protein
MAQRTMMDSKLLGSGDRRTPLHCARGTLDTYCTRGTLLTRCVRSTEYLCTEHYAAFLISWLEITAAACSVPDTHSYAKFNCCNPSTNHPPVPEEVYITFHHSHSLSSSNATSLHASSVRLPQAHVLPSIDARPPPVTRN